MGRAIAEAISFTSTEYLFSDLPGNRATERLRCYSDWRIFHRRRM